MTRNCSRNKLNHETCCALLILTILLVWLKVDDTQSEKLRETIIRINQNLKPERFGETCKR